MNKRPSGRNEPPFLMVGGPADGNVCDTLGDRVAVPFSKSHPVLEWGDEYAENVHFKVTVYRKEFWQDGRVCIFIPEGQTPEETLRLLIKGYLQE